jgi:hypothetical protein
VNAPPVLEPSEHVLDLVALFVEDGVMGDRGFPVGFRRNAGRDAVFGEGGAESVGVVTLVGEKLLGSRHGGQHQRRALEVAHLAFAEQHHERSTFAVANRVVFGVQAPFRASDTSGNRPFFLQEI